MTSCSRCSSEGERTVLPAQAPAPTGFRRGRPPAPALLGSSRVFWEFGGWVGTWVKRDPAEGILGSVWFLCNRYTPYPNLYPDQSPSEDWTMEERFRPLTFHGLILRSQLVTLLVRGVCYSESQSVSVTSASGEGETESHVPAAA